MGKKVNEICGQGLGKANEKGEVKKDQKASKKAYDLWILLWPSN